MVACNHSDETGNCDSRFVSLRNPESLCGRRSKEKKKNEIKLGDRDGSLHNVECGVNCDSARVVSKMLASTRGRQMRCCNSTCKAVLAHQFGVHDRLELSERQDLPFFFSPSFFPTYIQEEKGCACSHGGDNH